MENLERVEKRTKRYELEVNYSRTLLNQTSFEFEPLLKLRRTIGYRLHKL